MTQELGESVSLSLSSLSKTAMRACLVLIRGGVGVTGEMVGVVTGEMVGVVTGAAACRRHLPYRIHIGRGLGLDSFGREVVGETEVGVDALVVVIVGVEVVGGVVVEVEVFDVVGVGSGVRGGSGSEGAGADTR